VRLKPAAVLSLALLTPASSFGFGSSGAGVTGAQFLRLGAGARSLGMGEAMVSIPDGLNSLYWNPAGLASLNSRQAGFTHSQLYSDFYYDHAGYGQGLEAINGGVAGSLTVMQQSGLQAVSNTGRSMGTFKPYSVALAGGAGGRYGLEDRVLLAGAGLKVIEERLYDVKANAVAVDLGVELRGDPELRRGEGSRLDLGAAIRNLGTREKFNRESQSLPLEFALGASYPYLWSAESYVLAAVELSAPVEGQVSGKLGVEYAEPLPKGLGLRLRTGYKTLTAGELGVMSGFTVGFGVTTSKLAFDFGFQPVGSLGETYRLSVSYLFGPAPVRAAPVYVSRARAEAPPNPVEERFLRAETLIEMKNYEAAKSELQTASAMLGEEDPHRVRYYQRMGKISLAQGDVRDAKNAYTEALSLAGRLGMTGPEVADAYAEMGMCLLEEKNNVYALKYFKKALEAGPSPKVRKLAEKHIQGLEK